MSMHAMRARVVAFERSLEGVQPRVAYGFTCIPNARRNDKAFFDPPSQKLLMDVVLSKLF
jgi:hypothetical protein